MPRGPAGSGCFPSRPRDQGSRGSVLAVFRGEPGGRQDAERGWGGGIGRPLAESQGGGQARRRERGRPGLSRASRLLSAKRQEPVRSRARRRKLRSPVARPPAPSALEGQLKGGTRPDFREHLFGGPVTDGRAAASECPSRVSAEGEFMIRSEGLPRAGTNRQARFSSVPFTLRVCYLSANKRHATVDRNMSR